MAGREPSSVRDDELVVASCGAAEREEQARLHAQCFKKPLAPGGLSWRYDEVPHGPSVTFVARPPGGEAISGYACNPRRAIANGDEISLALVGETGDVMTHPAWRKRGFFSRLDRAAMEEARRRGWVLAFGLPNRKSAHIFLELGWERIGSVRPWTFVLAPDSRAHAWRRREGFLAGLLTSIAWRKGRVHRAVMRNELAAFRAGSLDTFPEAVEHLARRVERDFTFMLRRSKSYLDWRFFDAPSRLHRALAIVDREEVLCGYVVVQLPRSGAPVGYLIDLLARDDLAVRALIELALAELERAGASVVEATAIDGSWWSARLEENGFVPPRADNHLSVILYPLVPDHPLVAAARDTARWYFTDGDRDDETMG